MRSIFTIDDKENPQMVIHSSGLSVDYIWEEELSFWEFQDTFWALIPLEPDIDTSNRINAIFDHECRAYEAMGYIQFTIK